MGSLRWLAQHHREIAEACGMPHDVVWQTLADLEQSDLLIAPLDFPLDTRRGLLRSAAMATAGAAFAIPVIRSIAVPTVAHAAYGCTGGFCSAQVACADSRCTCTIGLGGLGTCS